MLVYFITTWEYNSINIGFFLGYVQNQTGLLSPTYAGGATYSFTADFRPPNVQEVPLITSSSSFKPVLNTKGQFSPVRNTRKMGYASPGKIQVMCGEDESQRPNLCRICGKYQLSHIIQLNTNIKLVVSSIIYL